MVGIASREDATKREHEAAMPAPARTARRGILAGRAMGLSERNAALMVMAASGAAIASVSVDPDQDVTWLAGIAAEAKRVYERCVQRES